MKKLLILSLVNLCSIFCAAQNYQIDSLDNQTVTTCSGLFMDSGGANGDYSSNENYTVTFCPSIPNSIVSLSFPTFSLGNGDQLCIYDGSDINAPLIDCFTNTNIPTIVAPTLINNTGCLSLVWSSDATSNDMGWTANITCQPYCGLLPPPSFQGTIASEDTVCSGDTLTLMGMVTPVSIPIDTGNISFEHVQTIFLPDGNGTCYTDTLTFDVFSPTDTITSINDIENICLNMEHSYMGDLTIRLTCPNGNSVQLHNQTGGGTFLGIPIDNDVDLSPGQGYDYCWSPNAPNSTWEIESASVVTLAPGTYTSSESLSGLIGCPLNGAWEVEICDFLASDNGYIFSWGINVNLDSIGITDSIMVPITAATWQNDSSIIQNQGNTIVVAPTQTTSYTFETINTFGCVVDTTIEVVVLPFSNSICDTTSVATFPIEKQKKAIFVATGFTPNQDNANDFLYVQGNDQTKMVRSFLVYNKWGAKVFEVKDIPLNRPELGWNGYFKNRLANQGMYAWIAEIELNNGDIVLYRGYSTLLK